MRRWIGPADVARLTGRAERTIHRRIKAGALDGIRDTIDNGVRKFAAEGVWKWHLTGSTEGCWELADLQDFASQFPLPEDTPGASRLAS